MAARTRQDDGEKDEGGDNWCWQIGGSDIMIG